jgi:hypothetical protein
LTYGSDAAATHLETSGWYLDTGKMDSVTEKDNPGLDKRKTIFKNEYKVELIGKIHADLFNQTKLLLNNVDLRIVLSLENS